MCASAWRWHTDAPEFRHDTWPRTEFCPALATMAALTDHAGLGLKKGSNPGFDLISGQVDGKDGLRGWNLSGLGPFFTRT